jgi:hypothetical protein
MTAEANGKKRSAKGVLLGAAVKNIVAKVDLEPLNFPLRV